MTARMPRAPAPPGKPLLGHARFFQRDPLGFLRTSAESCGPLARLQLGPLVYHLVSEPRLVAEVLQARAVNYVRDGRSARQMRLITGESLLSTSGETWRRHRRLAQPMFHHHRLAALAATTVAATQETAVHWERAAVSGEPIDLTAELGRLTFSIVGRAMFGTDLGPHIATVEHNYPVLIDTLFQRARALVALPMWVPTPGHRRFQRALAEIDALVGQIIAARKAAAPQGDLLDLLLQARDEDGTPLADAEIRNHAITFLLAGHETTASTLAWAFCLLAQDAATRSAIEAELATVLDGRAPTLETLPLLPRLDEALQETLRLYPAIWLAERRVLEPDTLGGCEIPAGSHVVVCPYVTQRLSQLWPDSDAFLPSRFRSPPTPPGLATGFFPFGAGPHQCIGQHFALLQCRLILATLLVRFRVRLQGAFPAARPGITLRSAGAVPVYVERR